MTYSDMSDDELRLAVAKAQGYELRHGFMDEACINPKDYWITPEGRLTSILPDYPRDIRAAYELEAQLSPEKAMQYAENLCGIIANREGALDLSGS